MKKWILIFLMLLWCAVAYAATTTNLSLYKPAVGEEDWGALVNANFDTIDATVGVYLNTDGEWVDADWGDISASSDSVTIDEDVIDKANFKDEDWGDVSVSTNSVTLDADVVDSAEIKDEAIDSEHYTDGSIDHEHLAPDVISGLVDTTIADTDYVMFWDVTDSTLKKVDGAELTAGAANEFSFKTITGITNDVVADTTTDTLTFTGAGIVGIEGTTATDTITITGTEVDGSITNELNIFTTDDAEATVGTAITLAGAGIAVTSEAGDTITITATEVDGSTTNEINTIQGDDDGATSGLAISIDGAGIVETDVVGDIMTITGTEVDGSTTNEINTITTPDAEATAGLGITFADTGIMTITELADTITFDATEVDGSTTNEINTITAGDANATAGLGITFVDAGIITTTELDDSITITATEADTLATVTGRGATTATASTFSGGITTGAISLDDGSGDSPTLFLIDEDNKYFAFIKYDTGDGSLFNNEGAIRLMPSNDTTDYLTVSTAADIITITTVGGGDGDLVITAAGGDISFGDDNISGTGTHSMTGGYTGALTGNAATVTNATLTTALTVNTGAVTLVGNAGASTLTLGAGASTVSGTNTGGNTGDNTVATSCTGESATVATITGLAPDTQNTYARTQYLIPYASTTTAMTGIAIGDDGQVLTSGGAGVAPSFEDAAGGGATYREMTLLPQGAVLDDDNPAVIDVVESSGTGTVRFYRAKFDDGDSDAINYSFTMPSDYTASADVILDIIWYSDEDVAENVVWAVQVSASTPNADADIEAQACDTTDTVTDSADGNGAKAPLMATLTIDYANMDGAIAGDSIILRFSRLGADGSDTHTNECYMKEIHLKIPRS